MIAGDEVGAEFGRELAPGRNEARRVDAGAVEHVTADEDDVGAELAELGDDARDEIAAFDVPRCVSVTRAATRPRQEAGRPGSFTVTRLMRRVAAFARPETVARTGKLKKNTAIPVWPKGRLKKIVIAIAIHPRHAAANAKFTKPNPRLARRKEARHG